MHNDPQTKVLMHDIIDHEGDSQFIACEGDHHDNSDGRPAVSQTSSDDSNATVLTPDSESNDSSRSDKDKKDRFYQYTDYSTMEDPTPNSPITKNGRIPSFPAKMYAILSRPELQDIVSWMPHGRSWKVHKPREFEIKVIPTYFEHSKFSSFIRQANGWGFRRMISRGPDRNSYYHEMFLRGKPHLLKIMKRPTANKKPLASDSNEPNFYKISLERPLPEEEPDHKWDGLIRKSSKVEQAYYPHHVYTGAPHEHSPNHTHSTAGIQYSCPYSRSMEPLPAFGPAAQSPTGVSQFPMEGGFMPVKARGYLPPNVPELPHLQSMPPAPTQVMSSEPYPVMDHPHDLSIDHAAPGVSSDFYEPVDIEPLPYSHGHYEDFVDPFIGGLTVSDFW